MNENGRKPGFVIILNYKKWDETLECLRSVFHSSWTRFKVIVIDNHSGNRSLENLSQSLTELPLRKSGAGAAVYPVQMDVPTFSATDAMTLPDLVFVQNDRNIGFAGGNNVALRSLIQTDAYIWLLNPDMTVDANALGEMVRLAESESNAVIGSVHRSFSDPGKTIQYGGARVNYLTGNASFIKRPEEVGRIGYISGGCLLADAAVYRAVGLLPEDYFLYWEETDWCYQARKKGFPMRVCPEAITYDKRSTTIGNGFLAEYFYTRNGLLFLKKYKRGYLLSAFLLVFARMGKKMLLGQPARARGVARGAIDFVTGRKYENQ